MPILSWGYLAGGRTACRVGCVRRKWQGSLGAAVVMVLTERRELSGEKGEEQF